VDDVSYAVITVCYIQAVRLYARLIAYNGFLKKLVVDEWLYFC